MILMIFLISLGIFLYVIMTQGEMAKTKAAPVLIKKCPPHKWHLKFPGGEHDHRGYLVCDACGYQPGDE